MAAPRHWDATQGDATEAGVGSGFTRILLLRGGPAMPEQFETLKDWKQPARGAGRTRSIGTHVMPELYDQIQAHCAACGKDLSAVTREIWQKEIQRRRSTRAG